MPMTSFLSTIPDKMIDNIISTILRQIIQPIGDQSTLAHTTFTSNDKMRVISSQEIVQYLKVTLFWNINTTMITQKSLLDKPVFF